MKTLKTGVKVINVTTSSEGVVVEFQVFKKEGDLASEAMATETLNFGKVNEEELKQRLLAYSKVKGEEKPYTPPNLASMKGKYFTMSTEIKDKVDAF